MHKVVVQIPNDGKKTPNCLNSSLQTNQHLEETGIFLFFIILVKIIQKLFEKYEKELDICVQTQNVFEFLHCFVTI